MHSAEGSFRGIRCRWHHSLARPARSKQYDLGQIVVHTTQLLNRSPCHVSALASISGVACRTWSRAVRLLSSLAAEERRGLVIVASISQSVGVQLERMVRVGRIRVRVVFEYDLGDVKGSLNLMDSRNHRGNEIAKGLLLRRLRKWYKKSVSVARGHYHAMSCLMW